MLKLTHFSGHYTGEWSKIYLSFFSGPIYPCIQHVQMRSIKSKKHLKSFLHNYAFLMWTVMYPSNLHFVHSSCFYFLFKDRFTSSSFYKIVDISI